VLTGLPAMRPLLLEYPDDPRFALESSSFLFGLISLWLRLWPGSRQRESGSLPAHGMTTGRAGRLPEEQTGRWQAPLDRIPLYAKEGAHPPSQQVVQHTGQQPIDPLTPDGLFPLQSNGHCITIVLRDDGLSFDYLKGVTFRQDASRNSGLDLL